jgi:hypothetical protein
MINAIDYFKEELNFLSGAEADGLLTISNEGILLTEVGRDFTQNIMNVFDKYDPPNKPYKDRLATIKIAKELQSKVQEELK